MTEFVVDTHSLVKRYGRVAALDGLSLAVPRGAVYGFLGRNGAGKTTAIRILAGLARPQSGEARVLGMHPERDRLAVLSRTGFVIEKMLLPAMTGNDLVRYNRRFFPTWSDALAKKYAEALEVSMNRKFKKLSHGNRTKLCLLLAVFGLWIIVRCHAFRVVYMTTSNGTTTPHVWTLGSLPFRVAAIDVFCAFLLLALVFAVTHLGTVAFRHSTAGLLSSLGFFVAWLIVTTILGHELPRIPPHIPDLLLHPYGSGLENMRLIPHLTSSLLERLAILPLIPLLAQLLLRRTEV